MAGAGPGVVAYGGTCLHVGRGGRVERFGGGLGDQRFEHVERKPRTAGDAFGDGVHVIDEIAGENRREMRFRPAGRVGPDYRARETAGEGFQLRAQGFVVGFEKDGNLRKIHFRRTGWPGRASSGTLPAVWATTAPAGMGSEAAASATARSLTAIR